MRNHSHSLIQFLSFLLYANVAFSGAPFLTEDPEPAEYRHADIYPFFAGSKLPHSTTLFFPALEIDYGIYPNVEASIVMSATSFIPSTGPRAAGIGDTEAGLKYQFLKETATFPATALSLLFELPTGDAKRNLGNGKTWYKFPLSFEKKWQKWDVYACIGYARNPAKFMENFWFGGMVASYQFTEPLSLGAELYYQSSFGRLRNIKPTVVTTNVTSAETMTVGVQDAAEYTLLNLGGTFEINKKLSFIFAGGHQLMGRHKPMLI